MKRILLAISALMLLVTVQASAQGFGVTAGMNFNSAKVSDIKLDSKIGWSVGLTYGINLPIGFSIQPSIVYIQKSADYSPSENISSVHKVGSINVPVSVQWGPDLIVARPFIDVTPYIGYSLTNKFEQGFGDVLGGEASLKNAFEYGVGIGAGLNIWRLQAIVRYNWNFGTLGNIKDYADIGIGDIDPNNETFGGVSLSLAYFF